MHCIVNPMKYGDSAEGSEELNSLIYSTFSNVCIGRMMINVLKKPVDLIAERPPHSVLLFAIYF